MKRNIERLIALYGSAAALARIAGVHRTAVARWRDHDWRVSDKIQVRLLREAPGLNIDVEEAAFCMGVRRCRHCQEPIDDDIHRLLEAHAKAKAA